MKRILACTDGSPYAQTCCQYAAWFSTQAKAHLDILYATEMNPLQNPLWADLGGSLGIDPFQDFSSKLAEIEEEKVKIIKKLTQELLRKEKISSKGFSFHHHFSPLLDIVESFEDSKSDDQPTVDMVFLGKYGENASRQNSHLGSSLERIVRSSCKPCVVTPEKFKSIKTIALATDDSESVNSAIKFLSKTNVFKNTLLHIISVNANGDKNLAENRIQKAQKKLGTKFKITSKVLTGTVESKIPSYIKRNKVDLLIMGAYGHSRIRNLIIGSTTTLLIQACNVPVMLFR